MSQPTWGGARAPANPAAVSGPGAHSARTDGGVMNPDSPSYGEVADVQSLQQAAPLAGAAGAAGPQGGGVPDLSALVGLSAPGSGGPVTAGAALGDGPGPDVLGLPTDPVSEGQADARSLPPGMVQALLARASSPDATPSFRRRVREVVAHL